MKNRNRDAQLPRLKTLEEFDFAKAPQIPAARIRDLAQGVYIERSEPVVLMRLRDRHKPPRDWLVPGWSRPNRTDM